MSNIVLFISEERLKTFSSISFNVDPNELRPYVIQAQDMYLKNWLGTTFFNEIKSQIIAGSVSANNKVLLEDYISQALTNYALWLYLPFSKYKLMNKGPLSPTAENAASATLEELKFLRQEAINAAEFYCKTMITHIKRNSGLYPTYLSQNSEDGNTPDTASPYFSGLFTPKRRPDNCGINWPASNRTE